jgi:drug/metabolite transporter (DMT)-like permease
MTRDSPTHKPIWLVAAPVVFLVLWSAGFGVAKLGLRHAEPLTFLALRYVIVLVLLVPLYLAWRPPLPMTARVWGHLAMVGFLIQAVYFGMCYVAFKAGVSAGGVAIIVCLQPIMVAVVAPHLVGERVSVLRWAGLALGLAGAATVIVSRSSVDAANPTGVAAAFLGLFGITAGTLWEKRFGTDAHPLIANLVQYAVGAACTLPLALASETMNVTWNFEFLAALSYLVIANSIISMTLLLAMIRAGEVSRVSSLFYLVPPLSAVIAWPLLGEALPAVAWLGMVLAAVGVALASRTAA